jgi:hypothetical protein
MDSVLKIYNKSTPEILQEGLFNFGPSLEEIPYRELIDEIKKLTNSLQNRFNSSIFDRRTFDLNTTNCPQIFSIKKNDFRSGMWYQAMKPFSIEDIVNTNKLPENIILNELVKIKDDIEFETRYFEVNLLYTNREHTKISLYFILNTNNYILKDITNSKKSKVELSANEFINEVDSYKKDIIRLLEKNNFNGCIRTNVIFEKDVTEKCPVYRFRIDKNKYLLAIELSDELQPVEFYKKYGFDLNGIYFNVVGNLKYIFDEELLYKTNLMILCDGDANKIFLTTKMNVKITDI